MSMLDNAVNKMIELGLEDIKINGQWNDGDEMSFIFKDGIGILSLENGTLGVKIIAGKPKIIDMYLDMLEVQADE